MISAVDPYQPLDLTEKFALNMPLIRLAIAVIFAPLAAPLVTILLMSGGNWPTIDSGMAWVFGTGAAFGYLGLILCGVPIVVGLNRLRYLSLVTLTLSGAVAGIVVFQLSLLALAVSLESSAGFDLLSVAYGALAGASVACCFGLIVGVGNLSGNTKNA
jgi:hypothetical protein